QTGGATPFVAATQLVPEFAKGVFALTKVGEISEPIKGPAAWHIVRLDERRPAGIASFDEVRDSIMKTLRDRFITQERDLRIQAIYRDPDLQVNQPAIDALVSRVDPAAMRPPKPEAKPGPEQAQEPAPAQK
ncbi:MAG: peptidyl-prolyl cis-trans isomerase, partial [Casimicrobiaceae bacterium]